MPVYSAISVRASTGLGSVPKQRSSERDFSPRTQHTTNVDIWCVCLSACLYAVCWEAHVPVLPYIAEKVGANSTVSTRHTQSSRAFPLHRLILFAGAVCPDAISFGCGDFRRRPCRGASKGQIWSQGTSVRMSAHVRCALIQMCRLCFCCPASAQYRDTFSWALRER
jgi:hypothetical protein